MIMIAISDEEQVVFTKTLGTFAYGVECDAV